MKYLLYLFDLDGTIINSERSILSSLRDTALHYGLRGVKWSKARGYIGTSLNRILEVLGIPAPFIPEAREFYRKRYYHYLDFFEEPYSGISEMLKALHNKVLLSICTNKGGNGTQTTLRKNGLEHYFDHLICASDFPPKPALEMMHEVIRLYASEGKYLEPSDILMIGDSASDAEFAFRNGMDFAFVKWGFFQQSDLPRLPEQVISYPMQLVWLQEEESQIEVEIGSEIDLHTYAPREVSKVVKVYLKEAVKKSLKVVRVIHGKGKGVQREHVRRILSQHSLVKKYYDAPGFMGGKGATIVELK